MPTYDYVCDACGHALEIFQSMSEAPKKKCPKCGKSKLARRIGAGAGFLFKGSGFYLTDYRSKSYTAGSEAERKLETSGQSGSDSTAPAATTPSSSDSKSPQSADKPSDKSSKSTDAAPKSAAPKKKPAKGD